MYFSFFDALDEIVYVADMDNYSVVYLNQKGLRVFGLPSVEAAREKNVTRCSGTGRGRAPIVPTRCCARGSFTNGAPTTGFWGGTSP